MTYDIKQVRGYFEVHIDGKFYCSADKYLEAVREVENYIKGGMSNESKSA